MKKEFEKEEAVEKLNACEKRNKILAKEQEEAQLKIGRLNIRITDEERRHKNLLSEMDKKAVDTMELEGAYLQQIKQLKAEIREAQSSLGASFLEPPSSIPSKGNCGKKCQMENDIEISKLSGEIKQLKKKNGELEQNLVKCEQEKKYLCEEKETTDKHLEVSRAANESYDSRINLEFSEKKLLESKVNALEKKMSELLNGKNVNKVLEDEISRIRNEVRKREEQHENIVTKFNVINLKYRQALVKCREIKKRDDDKGVKIQELEESRHEAVKQRDSLLVEQTKRKSCLHSKDIKESSLLSDKASRSSVGSVDGSEGYSSFFSPLDILPSEGNAAVQSPSSHKFTWQRKKSQTVSSGTQTAEQFVRSGGFSESFVIASKDHKIKRLERKIENYTLKLKELGCDVSEGGDSLSSSNRLPLSRSSKENKPRSSSDYFGQIQ